ncbi:hypothetical protein AZE42_13699 [Rhizopogon vesiculosus]|uniref:Uncharacterized protein n=1 Tax=Rhizopogon vesiculosus TaxID=180088 RepID=A0A1J8R494_9AGAM|nr:hypothetical protein AZE42_13699 [Rhizopogon vesiculosus]
MTSNLDSKQELQQKLLVMSLSRKVKRPVGSLWSVRT